MTSCSCTLSPGPRAAWLVAMCPPIQGVEFVSDVVPVVGAVQPSESSELNTAVGAAPAVSGPSWHACPPRPDCPHCNGSHPQALLDWSFLDAVYCISLKTRDDRALRVAEEFHRTGLCRYVRFFRPDKHPKKGIIGSWESHRQCAMDALSRGCRNALVFEDDVQFVRSITPARLRDVALTLERLPADWRIFYLGHWPVEAWFVRPNLLKTRSACAHAYIISPG
jgi:hypothetical protein